MLKKWHIIIVLIVTTICGGLYQDQYTVANQEIVLQYEHDAVSAETLHDAISAVQDKLHALGATKIEVGLKEHGALKVSYHSAYTIAAIKKALAVDQLGIEIAVNHDGGDQEGSHKDVVFSIDVYDLNQLNDIEIDTNGTSSEGIKFSSESSTKQSLSSFSYSIQSRYLNALVQHQIKVIYKRIQDIEFNLKAIPEVRAGPIV